VSRIPVPPCVGPGMSVRRALVKPRDVVFLKGLLEAADGLAQLFAEEGGAVTIATTNSQARDLDALLDAVFDELGAVIVDEKLVPVDDL
jgi:cobalamin biosynthesis protein CbiG